MIKPTPLATIFMPCYNPGAYLLDAVASVLSQTESNWELLIVDDGSTDGSIQTMQARFDDPRIRVHRLPQNMGTGVARNQGLDLARGQFLFNLDADDLALPERIARQTQFFRDHPEVDVLTGGLEIFDETKVHGTAVPQTDNDKIQALMLTCANNIANPASALRLTFARQHHVRYNPALRVAQDLDFWVSCVLKGATFAGQAQAMTRYRLHAQQAVRNQNEMQRGQHTALSRLLGGWFSDLSETQVNELALVMTPTSFNLDRMLIERAIVTLRSLGRRENTDVGSPNMPMLAQIMEDRAQLWERALRH